MDDHSYVFHSVQGLNIVIVGILGISIVAIVLFFIFRGEKKFQAGNDEEH